MNGEIVPVVVFAYARPQFLERTLAALEREEVPLVYVFCDGPKTEQERALTREVRAIAERATRHERVVIVRDHNWGLGRSILSGVTDVLRKHPWVVVLEDDLEFAAGTYRYFCTALERYRDEPRVMSVTGWTHPRVTPTVLSTDAYFDGRAESWSFATWARAWQGMDQPAHSKYAQCRKLGLDPYRYGKDLAAMVRAEVPSNLWAVRFAYHHLLNDGLCLRPRRSLVNHVGFDTFATNAPNTQHWLNAELPAMAQAIERWPEPVESYECPGLWQRANGSRPSPVQRLLADVYTSLGRSGLLHRARAAVRNMRSG